MQTPFNTDEPVPATIREYLRRCGEDEEPVTFWERKDAKDTHEALWVVTFMRATMTFNVMTFPVVVHHWSHQLYGGNYDTAGMERELNDGLWAAPEASKVAVRAFLASLNAGT